MKNLILITLIFFFVSCQTGGNWTATELSEWYLGIHERDSRFISPLYYQGTDDNFHYFICRSMDTWVPVKVLKNQINITDIRPYSQTTQTLVFPGYYIVDPKHRYKKVPEIKL